jgi:hypothetical protein
MRLSIVNLLVFSMPALSAGGARVVRGDGLRRGAATPLGHTRPFFMLFLVAREQRRERFERVVEQTHESLRRSKLHLFVVVRHALHEPLDYPIHVLQRHIEAPQELLSRTPRERE